MCVVAVFLAPKGALSAGMLRDGGLTPNAEDQKRAGTLLKGIILAPSSAS